VSAKSHLNTLRTSYADKAAFAVLSDWCICRILMSTRRHQLSNFWLFSCGRKMPFCLQNTTEWINSQL